MRKNLTEIVFILDRSGSMSGLEADTIGGFNSMIKKQKKENGEALISTVLFDNVSAAAPPFWMLSAEQFITLQMSISTQEKRMCLNTHCLLSRRTAWRMQAAVMTARRSRK